jgi:hypothetical protein
MGKLPGFLPVLFSIFINVLFVDAARALSVTYSVPPS